MFWFQRTGAAFDRMLLIKGPRWKSEREEAIEAGLLEGVEIEVIDQYRVPGHDNDSVILSVSFADN